MAKASGDPNHVYADSVAYTTVTIWPLNKESSSRERVCLKERIAFPLPLTSTPQSVVIENCEV